LADSAFMKPTLITVSIAAVALWIGFVTGYHRGERVTDARWDSDYVIMEIKSSHITTINRPPEIVTSYTNISR
jgi:hypothetical protein